MRVPEGTVALVCRVRQNPLPKQRPPLAMENLFQQASRAGAGQAYPGVERATGRGQPWRFMRVLWVQKLILKGADHHSFNLAETYQTLVCFSRAPAIPTTQPVQGNKPQASARASTHPGRGSQSPVAAGKKPPGLLSCQNLREHLETLPASGQVAILGAPHLH